MFSCILKNTGSSIFYSRASLENEALRVHCRLTAYGFRLRSAFNIKLLQQHTLCRGKSVLSGSGTIYRTSRRNWRGFARQHRCSNQNPQQNDGFQAENENKAMHGGR